MPPVRRHRIGDQLPAVVHPDPDPAAIALCRELVAETDALAVVLFGSRAGGGWDEQSDLDLIIVHDGADGENGRKAVGRILVQLKDRHYPGYRDRQSPHHGVQDGQMHQTPVEYTAGRRTLNHVIARAAREGSVFTRDPGDEVRFRHDGDVSNEWELVTLERLRRAARVHDRIRAQRTHFPWYAQGDPPEGRHRMNVHTNQGARCPRAALELGRGATVNSRRGLPPGLGGGNGHRHRPARRRLEPRLPQRPGPHRPVLQLRVRGGGHRSHRGRARHVARPGNRPGRPVGTHP